MEMFKVCTVEEARKKLTENFFHSKLDVETVDITKAVGRVLGEDVFSNVDVPHFRRSTVDGYALLSKDTFGASESLPVFLQVQEKIQMGKSPNNSISMGKASYVPTGGMLPEGADAVVMVEYVESFDEESIAVYRAVAPKENVLNIGDDIKRGERVLSKGMKLRPQDIGVLSSIGVGKVKVYKLPRFTVISTGDEIIDPAEELKPGRIRDINTYSLCAMVEEAGGIVSRKAVVRDDYDLLKKALENALKDSDIIIISGGSSVGTKDVTSDVINSVGKPGVFVHGVAIKPGKPTILSKVQGKPVFGLPGQPASAMIVFKVFVEYFIRYLYGVDMSREFFIEAISSTNIHSAQGKETYQMVDIEERDGEVIAHPVYGKSGMITLMSKAKGYIKIDTDKEGIKKGEKVKIYLF